MLLLQLTATGFLSRFSMQYLVSHTAQVNLHNRLMKVATQLLCTSGESICLFPFVAYLVETHRVPTYGMKLFLKGCNKEGFEALSFPVDGACAIWLTGIQKENPRCMASKICGGVFKVFKFQERESRLFQQQHSHRFAVS